MVFYRFHKIIQGVHMKYSFFPNRNTKMANNMTVVSIWSVCTNKININDLGAPFIFTSTC